MSDPRRDEEIVCGTVQKAAENGRSRGSARLELLSRKVSAVFLPLRLTARQLLHLGLVLAAGSGALGLWSGLLAGCPLYLLALCLVGDALRICHVFVTINFPKIFAGRKSRDPRLRFFRACSALSTVARAGRTSPPAFWCRTR